MPIWPELRELGLEEPASLADWANVGLGEMNLPWLTGDATKTLRRGMSYFLLDNQLNKTRRKSISSVVRTAAHVLRKPLHWRLRRHCFRVAAGTLDFDGSALAGGSALAAHGGSRSAAAFRELGD